MPKISVIVPVYKVEEYLDRCVDSILNQTFQDFELILVDDGSPDRCGEICDNYAKKDARTIVIHKKNGGLSDARNAGIDWAFANSDSEWITFIDSDDWVHRQYLEILYEAVLKYHVDISTCLYNDNGNFCEKAIEGNYNVVVSSPENILCSHFANIDISCAKMYKKSIFSTHRFLVGKAYEDGYLTHRILFSYERIASVQCYLYCYYYNPSSISNGRQSPKMIDNLLESDVLKVRYYAENNFVDAMNYSLQRVKCTFVRVSNTYYHDNRYRNIINTRKKVLHQIVKNNILKINDPMLKKYGFNRWIFGKTDRILVFKEDVKALKKEKGRIFAFFWKWKNIWKI